MENQSRKTEGLLHRIWKYKLHYVIVLPALLLIFIFKFVPFLTAVYLPFVDFNVIKGIFNSTWVGMGNFSKLFGDPAFRNVLSNTLSIKLEYIVASGLIALLIALALSNVKSLKLRNAFSTLFLIPYFIPSAVMAYMVVLFFGSSVLGNSNLFRPIFVAVEVLKTCGIPILMAIAAIGSKHAALARSDSNTAKTTFLHTNVVPAVRAISAFMLLQLSMILSTDFELVSSLYSPLVYEVADTLDTYAFRTGLLSANFSIAGAIWLFQFLVQLLFTGIAYLVIRRSFFHDIFSRLEDTTPIRVENKRRRLAGIGISAVYAIAVLVPLYLLFVYPFVAKSTSGISLWSLFSTSSFVGYFLINLAAVIINLLITLTLAYPLTVKDLPGRGIYKVYLLVVLVMGVGSLHEYILFKNMGMINTFYPHLFSGFISIISVFVLKSIFNSKYSKLKEKASLEGRGELHTFFCLFVPKVWKPLIALGVLQFVAMWNSFYSSLVYMTRGDAFSPIMLFKMISTAGNKMGIAFNDPIILEFGAIISLPSILLLVIFRKLLTSEVFISQTRKL
jgi:putative aldouronate transport system permease protein